jgi:hypothetical protein
VTDRHWKIAAFVFALALLVGVGLARVLGGH